MAALCPTAQESDWEWFVTSAGGEERLAMCLVWLHEVARQSFEDAFRLKLRVGVECGKRFEKRLNQFEIWEQQQRPASPPQPAELR